MILLPLLSLVPLHPTSPPQESLAQFMTGKIGNMTLFCTSLTCTVLHCTVLYSTVL